MLSGPIFIAGPTASGKSAVALELAQAIQGEIISVDSMQVYRGLDIGTAKPSPVERSQVNHHLIDVVTVAEPFDAARFVTLAEAAEKEITARRRVPIFCGGTGLYFNALLYGLGENPPSDTKLRAELEAMPLDSLLAELQKADSVTYERIDRSNPRRVVRAVEVIRLTGKPFSLLRAQWGAPPARGSWFALRRERADLHQRINARVDEMFARGLVAETQRMAPGLKENRVAMQALGYRQVMDYLEGKHDLPATVELVKQKTRQFAKRQMTWFSRQLPVEWIDVSPNESCAAVAAQISKTLAVQPPATI